MKAGVDHIGLALSGIKLDGEAPIEMCDETVEEVRGAGGDSGPPGCAEGRGDQSVPGFFPAGRNPLCVRSAENGSDDSRRWGTVPERNLVGRAFLIWMNWNGELGRPNFSRIGTIIE